MENKGCHVYITDELQNNIVNKKFLNDCANTALKYKKTIGISDAIMILKYELIKTQKELEYEKKLRRKNQWVRK